MSNESESEDDLLELAYDYKLNGSYPEGCTLNKKRSIRRKADRYNFYTEWRSVHDKEDEREKCGRL